MPALPSEMERVIIHCIEHSSDYRYVHGILLTIQVKEKLLVIPYICHPTLNYFRSVMVLLMPQGMKVLHSLQTECFPQYIPRAAETHFMVQITKISGCKQLIQSQRMPVVVRMFGSHLSQFLWGLIAVGHL